MDVAEEAVRLKEDQMGFTLKYINDFKGMLNIVALCCYCMSLCEFHYNYKF